MTTLNDLRQRIEDEYLEPLTEETPVTFLADSLNDTQSNFTLVGGVLSPDEENYIAPGRILEFDNELVRILSYSEGTRQGTCRRGVRGSTKAAHDKDTAEVRIPTRWARHRIIEALTDAIEALWEPLFIVKEERATVGTASYLPLPLNTVRILEVQYQTPSWEWDDVAFRLFATHPLDETHASVQIGELPYPDALCVIRYGVEISVPAEADDEIVDLPAKWERIILADAAAQLLAGVDIDAVTQEYLTEQLRLERFPVRSGATISQNLIKYREYLVGLEENELKMKHSRRVRRLKFSLWR